MGGKIKKGKFDAPLSKTARASKGKKKDEGYQPSGELDRFVPLARGEYAYLRDPRDGRTLHLRVGSDKWNTVIGELLGSVHGNRIKAQLIKFNFPNEGVKDE